VIPNPLIISVLIFNVSRMLVLGLVGRGLVIGSGSGKSVG